MAKELVSKSGKLLKAFLTRRLQIHSDRIPYYFEGLSMKKLFNACLAEASVIFKPERPWGWPVHLMIEPTNTCNLRCSLCPVTAGLERPYGHMSMKTFTDIIDEVGDYIFTLLLWDWGEPFLNPHIYDMIAYAKRKEIKIISSTNGHLFCNEDHADRVVKSGLDTVIFAIDGINQKTYERYRQGGKLDEALCGIRNVVSRKRALKSKTPLVNLRFIVMRHNEHEIPRLEKFARSLGVDALTLKTLNPYSQDPYVGCETEDDRGIREFLPEDQRYHRFKYDATGLRRIRLKNNPCKHLWNCPVIHWNGTVCTCTYETKEKCALGDIGKTTFRDVWLGKTYRSMRHQFRKDWGKIDFCRECSYSYKGGNCSCETMADIFFFDQDSSDSSISG